MYALEMSAQRALSPIMGIMCSKKRRVRMTRDAQRPRYCICVCVCVHMHMYNRKKRVRMSRDAERPRYCIYVCVCVYMHMYNGKKCVRMSRDAERPRYCIYVCVHMRMFNKRTHTYIHTYIHTVPPPQVLPKTQGRKSASETTTHTQARSPQYRTKTRHSAAAQNTPRAPPQTPARKILRLCLC
jgi:hypothetical protein